MSRGPGRTQREALATLERLGNSLDPVGVAVEALGRPVTEAEASSYRRALRGLARAGLVVDLGRGYRYGRRHYATPAVAAAYAARVLAVFGESHERRRPL